MINKNRKLINKKIKIIKKYRRMINKNIRMFKKYMKMISNKRVNKRKGEYSATNNEKSVGNGLNQC